MSDNVGIWRSQDYGVSFSEVSNTRALGTWEAVNCQPDGQVCLAGQRPAGASLTTPTNIYRSTDSGLTWTYTGFSASGSATYGISSSTDGQYW